MYRCSQCGYASTKWLGRCPSCGGWNTLVEATNVKDRRDKKGSKALEFKPLKLSDISGVELKRLSLTSNSLSMLFGGGIAEASVILLAGEPGIGKSTFLMSIVRFIDHPIKVLYVSGEETVYQVADRARRIGTRDIYFLSTNSLEALTEILEEEFYGIVIVDSIQTLSIGDSDSVSGSPTQIRGVTEKLVEIAKTKGIIVFIAGHVTKVGDIAGPKLLEHLVDVVLYIDGERTSHIRFLKCYKNRFGSTGNVVVFELTSSGINIVENPSGFFLEGRRMDVPGSVISSVVEGARSFLVEVQALVTKALYPGAARRLSVMYDVRRLFFILAVMEKYMAVNFRDLDIYINVPGGIMIKDNSCDLAIVTAIYSSYRDKVVPDNVVVFGEVGLGGEVRAVRDVDIRLKEAFLMGKRRVFLPKGSRFDKSGFHDLEIVEVDHIIGLTNYLFE
ncbi:MAG: DNA repair protein RadA [Thermosulfidibacteraceae bacterium]